MNVLRGICLLVVLLSARASAITISLEYVNPSDTFFTTAAKATLAKAASDLGSAITTHLSALSQDVYTGTNGGTSVTGNWSLSYINPQTNSSTTLDTFSLLSNDFHIFVGSQDLAGSTLGHGGPGGAGIGLSGSGSPAQWDAAIANMQSLSNIGMTRGGPALGSLTGSFAFGAAAGNYNLNYGYTIGAVAFDDLVTWNLDYTSSPGVGQNDFYSVALHEFTHALGFGTGDTWNADVSGTNWLGTHVAALRGNGTNVLYSDGAHVASGLTGHPLINGAINYSLTQEAAMDPTLTTGTRKYLTDLDLAFLSDMGWQVIPEPASNALLAAAIVFLLVLPHRLFRRSFARSHQ